MDTCYPSLCIHINHFIHYYKVLRKKANLSAFLFEYIAGMTIGDIAAQIATGLDQKFFHGVFAILIFASVPFFVGILSLKNKTARDFLKGSLQC